MPKSIISDTSTLILFEKIGRLTILRKIYGELIITPEIAEEFGEKLPEWILVKAVENENYKEILKTQLGLGEASAIALAKELDDNLLLLDDLKARKLAKKLKLRITGVLGIINKAKGLGIIENVRPIINELLVANFWISKKMIHEFLKMNNEEDLY